MTEFEKSLQHMDSNPGILIRMRSFLINFVNLSNALGLRAAIELCVYHHIFTRRTEDWVRPKQVRRPLCVRRGASDREVLYNVLIDLEYDCLDGTEKIGLILDCGANVGYTSAFFLSKYPECVVVAVEADSRNWAVLQRNIAPYGSRATSVHAGIWSRRAPLVLRQEPYRDGREWSRQVRACAEGEAPEFQGVDIGSLLEASGHLRISLLKMDIEGAEAVVFSEGFASWLPMVDVIAIELHDDTHFGPASEIFFAAIKGQGFQISKAGELTICRRPRVGLLQAA